MDYVQQWLKEAKAASGMTLEQLGAAIQRTKANVGHMMNGDQRPSIEQLIALSQATKHPLRIDILFDGAVLDGFAPAPALEGVAQTMSLGTRTLPLQRHTVEGLKMADLNQPFELIIPDDALAPEIFQGCIGRFVPPSVRSPRAGFPILVRDAAGAFSVRDYETGASGTWRAVARSRGYAALDSGLHGLSIVAVMQGFDWP